MKRPENKVENAGASIWTRPALIGWENRRRTCVLPRNSTWLKIAGPHFRNWCNFLRGWMSHTYVFASFDTFTTLIFAVLLLNRVNTFALLRNNRNFQWRENRKSIFLLPEVHTLFLCSCTLECTIFFLYFFVQDEWRNGPRTLFVFTLCKWFTVWAWISNQIIC